MCDHKRLPELATAQNRGATPLLVDLSGFPAQGYVGPHWSWSWCHTVTNRSTRVMASPCSLSSTSPYKECCKGLGASPKSGADQPTKNCFRAITSRKPTWYPAAWPLGRPGSAATRGSCGRQPASVGFCSTQPGDRNPVKHRSAPRDHRPWEVRAASQMPSGSVRRRHSRVRAQSWLGPTGASTR